MRLTFFGFILIVVTCAGAGYIAGFNGAGHDYGCSVYVQGLNVR